MPTILRFQGFNIVIYIEDHRPAHVHVKGHGVEAIFLLNCSNGRISLRAKHGMNAGQEGSITRFLEEKKIMLCKAWEQLHG